MKPYQSLFLIILPVLTGCSTNSVQTAENHAIPVRVERIRYIPAGHSNIYVGIAEAEKTISLSFLTSGTIESMMVEEGQFVRKGQLLATIDNASYNNAYQVTAAKEKQAADAYQRLSDVYKNGSLPEVKMVEIETGLEQARSAMLIAKKNLRDCELYAPAEGFIGKRSIEPGMNVMAGTPVYTIVKTDRMYMRISVPENEIGPIKKGDQASVHVAAVNKQDYTGKIETKGVMANPLSHTYEVKIIIDNSSHALMPGMVGNVTLTSGSGEVVMTIPQQAVLTAKDEQRFVFLADTNNHRAVRREIETGDILRNGRVVVTAGINENDRVITEGYQKINENSAIEIIR